MDGVVHGSEVGPPSRELGKDCGEMKRGGGQVMGEGLPSSNVAEKGKRRRRGRWGPVKYRLKLLNVSK